MKIKNVYSIEFVSKKFPIFSKKDSMMRWFYWIADYKLNQFKNWFYIG